MAAVGSGGGDGAPTATELTCTSSETELLLLRFCIFSVSLRDVNTITSSPRTYVKFIKDRCGSGGSPLAVAR